MADPALPHRAALQHEVPGSRQAAERPAIPRRVVASWQRSEDYGVSLETVEPVYAGTYDTGSLFFECGQEVLTTLHRTLARQPVSLMLTDADGRVLNRVSGDESLLRALDRVHLAPGFGYAEKDAGTNGLGLALADRLATVVRAEEHYSLGLCAFTCAAVPVLDPMTGRLEGSVNLTTWASSPSDLLLALAQSAASTTTALMLARSGGRRARPTARGELFRVETPRLEAGAGSVQSLSTAWTEARAVAQQSLGQGHVVAAVGEPGSGRATLLTQAERRRRPRGRILSASAPDPADVEPWLGLWVPELTKPETSVVVRHVDRLPTWVADRVRDLVLADRLSRSGQAAGVGVSLSLTADRFEDIPSSLAALVDTVVTVPPLRERPADVAPLVEQAARRTRGRPVGVTSAAMHVLENYPWPGNVAELQDVVRRAAGQADVVDLRHLPPGLLSGSTHRLSRIESFERDEIVRVLTQPGTTMREAADELGMSRATVYRKLAQYDIRLPRST